MEGYGGLLCWEQPHLDSSLQALHRRRGFVACRNPDRAIYGED